MERMNLREYHYHVTMLTPEKAEQHDRMVYNVDDDTRLGWTPYTIRVSRAAINQRAFHSLKDFRRWMSANGLTVDYVSHRGIGMRALVLKTKEAA